ncbi:MAG: MFS transporter [Candidatus Bathyarchaeota archaeon]|nr:MFS transporter [Candidatus Bathyarchaeota archaeon]MDH5745938.1 MFS transporter [Candidatus Bathyarchaeota archaeon]
MFKWNRNLKVLFFINVSISLSSSLVSPLFPLFLDNLGATVSEISFVLFTGGVAATILMVPSGLLSDRFRRRNILILSCIMLGSGAFYLTTVTSWSQSVFGIMLFLSALSIFLPARHTIVADNADPSVMTTTYSLMNVAWPTGSIIGPVLGGFLADRYGWNYTFYVATLVSLASIIPTFFFKRTYRGDKKRDKKKFKGELFKRDFIILLIVFSLFQIFASAAMGIMDPVVPLYLTQTFNVDKTTVGFFFSMGIGVATLLAQFPSGILADKYGRKRVLAYSILPLPFILLLWPYVQNYLFIAVLYMFIMGLWSMTWSVAVAYLMALTPTLERGFVISIRQAAIRLGFTVGPLIGGYFWVAHGTKTPFSISAVFFALSLLLIWFLKNSEEATETPSNKRTF